MIDDTILEKVIPIPDEEKQMQEIQEKLQEEGFIINNFSKGGVFYTIIRICVKIGIELKQLARTILSGCFIRHAEGDWMVVKAADFGKFRKAAVKAQGYITVYRSNCEYALKVKKGHMFKTAADINGKEYKFYAVADAVLEAGCESGCVLVEAEESGDSYNLPENTITISMIHLESVDRVINEPGWLYREGAEEESIENLRSRTLASWDEIAERTIDEKLRNAARSVPGVLNAEIDSQHPRGQGTVDIIITGTAGEATDKLLEEVGRATEYLKSSYDDFLCRSSTIVRQDITLTLYLAKGVSTEGVREQAEYLIRNLMELSVREEMHCLYLDHIRVTLANKIKAYKRASITVPSSDIEMAKGTVIMLGELTVNVASVGGA